jgi:hypothetical protein
MQQSPNLYKEWKMDQKVTLKWSSNLFERKFCMLAPTFYNKSALEAYEVQVPILNQIEYVKLHQKEVGLLVI